MTKGKVYYVKPTTIGKVELYLLDYEGSEVTHTHYIKHVDQEFYDNATTYEGLEVIRAKELKERFGIG